MITLNIPHQVFDLLSCIYDVFWYHILKVEELVLKYFNNIIKGGSTINVVLYIPVLFFICFLPVVRSVIRVLEILY